MTIFSKSSSAQEKTPERPASAAMDERPVNLPDYESYKECCAFMPIDDFTEETHYKILLASRGEASLPMDECEDIAELMVRRALQDSVINAKPLAHICTSIALREAIYDFSDALVKTIKKHFSLICTDLNESDSARLACMNSDKWRAFMLFIYVIYTKTKEFHDTLEYLEWGWTKSYSIMKDLADLLARMCHLSLQGRATNCLSVVHSVFASCGKHIEKRSTTEDMVLTIEAATEALLETDDLAILNPLYYILELHKNGWKPLPSYML